MSSNPMNERLTRTELAIDYVLGMVEGEDHERALRLIETDQLFRAEVTSLREKLGELDRTAPERPAKALTWQGLEQALDAPATVAAARAPEVKQAAMSFWQSLSFWRPAAFAAGLTAVVLGGGLIREINKPAQQPVYVAVLQTDQGRAQAVVNAYADGTVTLVPIEQIGLPEGRIIEVWTLQSREQGPVSIGRMDKARTLRLDLVRLKRPDSGHLFEMTVEPTGGSPTGKPTGPILSKGLAGLAL